MSTTVTYKGQTIATVDNDTKTLTTAGTWVEGDISLTDTSTHPSGSATYTQNGTYDVTALAQAVVDVAGGYTIDELASTEPSGAITLTTPTVRERAFYYNPYITSVTTNGTTSIGNDAFSYCNALVSADLTGVTSAGAVKYCPNLTTLLIPDLVTITNQTL